MSAELKAIIDKVQKAVGEIDSAKSRGYNNSTEVAENGRRVGNEETGGIITPEGSAKEILSGLFI